MAPLTMPKLSDSMEEATIVRWLKSEGEPFTRGEPLAEIETDKATIVYEAEGDGVIRRFVVPEGGTARVGDAIARPRRHRAPTAVPPVQAGRARATPVARRRAVELGLSLHALAGHRARAGGSPPPTSSESPACRPSLRASSRSARATSRRSS